MMPSKKINICYFDIKSNISNYYKHVKFEYIWHAGKIIIQQVLKSITGLLHFTQTIWIVQEPNMLKKLETSIVTVGSDPKTIPQNSDDK